MTKRTVKLTLRYDGSLLALPSHEMAPVLTAWSSFTATKQFQAHGVAMPGPGWISAPIAMQFPLPAEADQRRDDALWFEAYALAPNDAGRHVRNRVGCGFVYVSELQQHFARQKQQQQQPTPPAPLLVSLDYFNYFDKDGHRVRKGAIAIDAVVLPDDFVAPRYDDTDSTSAAASVFDYVPAQNSFLQSEMETAIGNAIYPFTDMAEEIGGGIEPYDDKDRRVHAPAWNGPTGYRPGYAYFITPGQTHTGNTAYFITLLRNVLDRHGMSEEQFVKIVKWQLKQTGDMYDDRFTECCEILGEACCAPAISLPYIGDAIDTEARIKANARGRMLLAEPSVHGVESFDWAVLRKGGDCEDLGRLIYAHFLAIKDIGAGGVLGSSQLLKAASRLAQCYIGGGVLTSVLGAQLSDEAHHGADEPFVLGTRRDNEVKIGAHIYTQLIPEHKALALIKRTVRDLDVEALRSPHAPRATWIEKMPHLVLEGTGMLSPLQRPRISYATNAATKKYLLAGELALQALHRRLEQRAVAQFRGRSASIMAIARPMSRQRLLKRVPNARVGGFYRNGTHFMTDEFLRRGFSVAEFTWATLDEPQLVPASACPDYSDDPMLAPVADSVAPPAIAAALAVAAAAEDMTEWERLAADGFDTSSSEEDDDDDNDEADKEGDAAAAEIGDRAPTEPGLSSSWRRPLASAAALLGGKAAAEAAMASTATRRFDTFDYASDEPVTVRYGVPLTSSLEDRPMLPHVALLPGAVLDTVAAGVLATHFRHSKPVPLAGDMTMPEAMHAAQQKSLRYAGVDVEKLDSNEQSNLQLLEAMFEKVVPSPDRLVQRGRQPSPSSPLLCNLYMPASMLRTEGVAEFVVEALASQVRDKLITHGKVCRESYVPGEVMVRIQLVCDPARI